MSLSKYLRLLGIASALALAAACSSAGPSSSSSAPPPSPQSPVESPPAFRQAEIGHNPGNRVPQFEIHLADSVVESSTLLDQQKPTFLFFFTTW